MAQDDLFTPSVAARPMIDVAPFRSSDLFYVGAAGGPLAVLHLARASSRRLHQPARNRQQLVAACTVIVVLLLVGTAVVAASDTTLNALRLVWIGSGVLASMAASAVLRLAVRRFEMTTGRNTERVGLARGARVCLGWGLVQVVPVLALVAVLR